LKLEIWLLGTPSIALEGRRLEFSRRKTEAILYYLAGKGVDISASSAANLLWPEYAPDRARASLRRTLCDATAVAGRRLIERRGRCIGFAADLEIGCDAQLFMALSSRGLVDGDIASLGKAASIYRGEFLEGFYLDDALIFEDWQLLESENFKNRAAEVFRRLAQIRLGSGGLEEAEAWGRRLAATDPLAPAGHRLLMEIAAARGNIPEALKDYEVYARILERELGAKPDPELEVLRDKIRAGERSPRPSRPSMAPEKARHAPLRTPAQRDVDMGT
jgi:DNA-binding SARP family transcriptional activator